MGAIIDPQVLNREQIIDALIMVFRDVKTVRMEALHHTDEELRAVLYRAWHRPEVVMLPDEWTAVFADSNIEVG